MAEGVAAPLEPTKLTAEKFAEQLWRDNKWIAPSPAQKAYEFAEAYAAAVSKNLQQSVEQLCGDVKAIQQDYTNEKNRAENLQEECGRLLLAKDCDKCGEEITPTGYRLCGKCTSGLEKEIVGILRRVNR